MITAINRFGLKRNIDAPIKREIRQNCGFGCVICGLGIFEYEHVEPTWVNAKSHDPSNMTLLCVQCHGKKTRGMLSVETIQKAMKNPKCKQVGFSNEFFDLSDKMPLLIFGGTTFTNCRIPVRIGGEALFEILPPEESGALFRLNASIYDSKGDISLHIIENEWRALNTNWDVEIVGPLITIREKLGQINLVIRAMPPDGIAIERLQMTYAGVNITGNVESLTIDFLTITKGKVDNSEIGFDWE
ncbi:HNH endonuclease [Pedobacter antarcticus]|uniref:HNH endonuclease n=1 Tax=Pedobacter antarcticus TaxID=34086 RepID=UPI00292F1E5C|nr:HNH endonuclease [Pedobacter antarcticus]